MKVQFQVYPGQRTDVQLHVRQTISDKAIRNYDLSERNCRSEDEVPGALAPTLTKYSKKACLYHCALREATSVARCVPWDQPRHPTLDNPVPLCTRNSSAVFRGTFDTVYESAAEGAFQGCQCLENCEEVVYEYKVDSSRLDSEVECQKADVMDLALKG